MKRKVKDLILSEEKGERKLMVHDYIRFKVHGEWLMVVGWRDEK